MRRASSIETSRSRILSESDDRIAAKPTFIGRYFFSILFDDCLRPVINQIGLRRVECVNVHQKFIQISVTIFHTHLLLIVRNSAKVTIDERNEPKCDQQRNRSKSYEKKVCFFFVHSVPIHRSESFHSCCPQTEFQCAIRNIFKASVMDLSTLDGYF